MSRAGPPGALRSPPKNRVRRGAECQEQARPEMVRGLPVPPPKLPAPRGSQRALHRAALSGKSYRTGHLIPPSFSGGPKPGLSYFLTAAPQRSQAPHRECCQHTRAAADSGGRGRGNLKGPPAPPHPDTLAPCPPMLWLATCFGKEQALTPSSSSSSSSSSWMSDRSELRPWSTREFPRRTPGSAASSCKRPDMGGQRGGERGHMGTRTGSAPG